jgi:hypothetical protein
MSKPSPIMHGNSCTKTCVGLTKHICGPRAGNYFCREILLHVFQAWAEILTLCSEVFPEKLLSLLLWNANVYNFVHKNQLFRSYREQVSSTPHLMLLNLCLCYSTDRHCREVGTAASYSVLPGFESQFWDRLCRVVIRKVPCYSQSLKQMPDTTVDNDCSLSDPCPFFIPTIFSRLRLHNPCRWKGVVY